MGWVPWSASRPATNYTGYYTVGMPVETAVVGSATNSPQGVSYMTISSVSSLGVVTYSGKVADGTNFSGSAKLAVEKPGRTRNWAISRCLSPCMRNWEGCLDACICRAAIIPA